MPRDHLLRRLLVSASIIGIVGAWAARVDAHAVFVGAPGSVAADTDVSLTMNVPHERDDTTYNVGVAIRLPEGWAGVACQSKPTWTCSIGVESGLVVIRFDKDPSAAPAEDETFRVTVHSGATPGPVSFPTLQTYSTGETVAWIGPAGSTEPAPILQVAGAPSTTTQVAVTPTTVPTTAAPTTAATAPTATTPAPTTAAAAPTAPTATTATTTTIIRPSSTTTTTAAATSTSTSTTTSTLPTGTESSLAPTATATELSVVASGGGGGGTAAAMIAIALALLASCAGVFVYRRRRTTPAGNFVDPPPDPPSPSATE